MKVFRWKTRYIHGNTAVRRTIVDFAKKKLLNSTDDDDDDEPRRIAPLAIRLPLKFNALTQKGREAEHRQIESHMRICLNIDSEAEVMYSVAPSEPILNEAAAQIMDSREKDSPGHTVKTLQKFLSDRYLSKGDRGELACMLLLLLARDQTCKAQEAQLAAPDPKLMPYNQPIRVTGFLTNLFAENHKETILNFQSEIAGATLEDTFCDSWMHFTHFIKVHDFKVVK